MFNLNDLQEKRKELEKAIATGNFERSAEESVRILGCSCSGSCEGTCDDSCQGRCSGCGSK